MLPLGQMLPEPGAKWSSFLISGACDDQGQVPLVMELARLTQLAQYYPLNLHTGYVADDVVAAALGRVATVFSCDFVGTNQVAQEVYGLPYSVDQYLTALLRLKKYGRVVPHVCLGLAGTALSSERQAVHLLVEAGFEEVVFLIFRPTPGTRYQDRQPPSPEEVAQFWVEIGATYPQLSITLGCMRPSGRYRKELDTYAVLAGVNAIVQPAPSAIQVATELNLRQSLFTECCSFRGESSAT